MRTTFLSKSRLALSLVASACVVLGVACGGSETTSFSDNPGGSAGSSSGGVGGTNAGGTGDTGGAGAGGIGGSAGSDTGGSAGDGGSGGTDTDASPDGSDTDASDATSSDDGTCVPAPEVCDGIDNDCNGIVDDDGEKLCSDGQFCNGVEVCAGAQGCLSGPAPTCDDGIACTADVCDPASNACLHTGNDSLCDDGIPCTIDACDVDHGCVHTPSDALCDDGVFCDGVEECNPLLGCTTALQPSCDDNVSCTDDFCDLNADACVHVPNDTHCADGLICNGAEVCDPANGNATTGCRAGTPLTCDDQIPCTLDACSEAAGGCTHTPQDSECDDGLFCNGPERCDGSFGCRPGAAPSCDDDRTCTQDSCSETLKACQHVPVHSACDDGQYCNGAETCSVSGPTPSGCVAGTPVSCTPDSIPCTVDICDEATDTCIHVPDNSLCGPGQFCVIAQNGCTPGKPCTTQSECQDGDLCNGVETCSGGICQPGTPVDCEDYIPCTHDTCNPITGACSHVGDDALCDNGLACDGQSTCQAGVGCVNGPAVNCDDGIDCTYDQCQEPAGTCTHAPQDWFCDDGKLCNGLETCDPAKGCQPAASAYVCPDDGVACTTQVCDPTINACKPIPHSDQCPCGQTCDPVLGCGAFCTVSKCQGKVYACGDCLDNDGDCMIDSADTQCLGPCDNTEDSFYGGIPGQNNSPCKSDCYFDQDTGSGNDDCFWSHKCDPLEIPPAYPPEGSKCAYDPGANIPGYSGTCDSAWASQSSVCLSYCGPLTPNGCDCFGCCEIPGAPTTVWLGSENPPGTGSCNINTVNDPARCKPCTQVPSCLNTCEHCEICIGKPDLPPDCVSQICPPGLQACGLPGQAPCPVGKTCITGCCYDNPE